MTVDQTSNKENAGGHTFDIPESSETTHSGIPWNTLDSLSITQNIPKSKDLGSSWGQAIVSVSGTSDFPTCAGHKCHQVPRLRNFNDKSTRHISASMTSTPRHKDFPLAAAGILVVDGHIRLDPTEGVLPCADRSDRFDK